MAYEEMSKEEAAGVFFRPQAQPQTISPQMSPAEAAPIAAPSKAIPAKAQKPSAEKIDTPALVSDVATAAAQIKSEAPKPEPISAIDALVNELVSNWKPLAIGAGVVAGASVGSKLLSRRIASQNPKDAPPPRIEPTFEPGNTTPPLSPSAEPKPLSPMEILEARKNEITSALQQNAPEAPKAPVPPVGVQADVPAPMPVQPPVAVPPAEPPVPSVTQAVVSGQSPAKAVQLDVANQLDEASGVAQRVRRTKAQIEQAAAEALANAPEGKLPAAPKKTNKMPGDVIGQGGWHWYEGQMGPQAEQAWLREFGRTNQPYSRVVEAVKEGRLPVPAPAEGKKGGAFPRQQYVPEYIKGSASLSQLGALAANALGAVGLLEAYKQGKQTGDYSDLGLGAIGQILGNIAPKTATAFSLMAPSETNKGEKEELAKRRKMKPTVN